MKAAPDNTTNSKPAQKRILAHICCAPCSIYPLKTMLEGKTQVVGFFHNPNVHPASEFRKRLEATRTLARLLSIDMVYDDEYRPLEFIRNLKKAGKPDDPEDKFPVHGKRCAYCYEERLEKTAQAAKDRGFEYFTSSLLYSRYQDHDSIKRLGIDLALKYGILFYYEDFRAGWQEGIDKSKELELYRQKYCGCVYSMVERYSKKYNKKKAGFRP